MKIVADTHVHTIKSMDAFSTLQENLSAAKSQGLSFLAVTDHAPAMPAGPIPDYFLALCATVPNRLDGVELLKGVEADVTDFEGNLDVPLRILERLDWIVASMHRPVLAPGTRAENTRAWLAVAQNPWVDVLGHCGNPAYPFDHEPVVKECAAHGTLIEINAHSPVHRPGSREVCAHIANLCAEYGVPVVVSSDAHAAWQVGHMEPSLRLLEEIHFPPQLILNASEERFGRFVAKRKGRTLPVLG